jgi:hypothetical protein
MKIYFRYLKKNIFSFLDSFLWLKFYFFFIRNNKIIHEKLSYNNIMKIYTKINIYIYEYIYLPLKVKYKFYEYYVLTYIDIFNFMPYLQDRAMVGNEVAQIWGSDERMNKIAEKPDSWWNTSATAPTEWLRRDISTLLKETYSWSALNWTGLTFLRIFFIFIYFIFKLIKQIISYNIHILFSYKLIHFKLEELKFNLYYTYIYIYIYLISKLDIYKMLKLFSVHHYLHLEIITYTYDIMNNNLLIIWNVLNPFFKNSINYIHPNIEYRRKLPLNKIFMLIYKKVYPVIYNYNYNYILFYNIKFLLMMKVIFLRFFILFNIIFKNIFVFINKYKYIFKYINIYNNLYKKNKNLYKDFYLYFFFYIFFFNYFTTLSLIIIFLFFLLKNIKNYIFYILGYIFIFIFDLFINFINKIYKLFIYLMKFVMIYIFIYICYKFVIIYVCNDRFINFIIFNVKLDIMKFIIYYVEWYLHYYNLGCIEDINIFKNIIKEAKNSAWDDITEPFENMWKQWKMIYFNFEWSIFSYENFMNKWLGSYKKEEHKAFRFVSMFYIKQAINSIKDMIKIFINKVIWYSSFYVLNDKYLYNKYLINMDMDFYWWRKILRKLYLKSFYIYKHFKYIYIYFIPYHYGKIYSYLIYNIYSIIYIFVNYIYLTYLDIMNLDIKKKIIILINFIYNFKIYILLFYNEYNKNLFNLILIEKTEQIEKLFFSVYLKWFNIRDNIKMLFYNIFRFEIEEWKDLDPEALDRLEMVTKRYWLSFGDQNLLNKLVRELEEIYQYGSKLKIATEAETEAVLKEIDENKKLKEKADLEKSIIAKTNQIKEILAVKFKNKETKNKEIDFDLNSELAKGEIVVVQMEEDDSDKIIIDFDKMDRAEIFGILGFQESKIAVVKKKMTNYWDFDLDLLYDLKDMYDFSEFYDGSYLCILYKLKYEMETRKKYMNNFTFYYIVEYFFFLYLYNYLYRSTIYIKEEIYNIDYKWKDLRKELDNNYIDNSFIRERFSYYLKQRKIKFSSFINYFWDNILNVNSYNETILNFYEQDEITKKKYRKLLKELKLYKIKEKLNVFFPFIKEKKSVDIIIENLIFKEEELDLEKINDFFIINNYFIDKNIFNDFKKYFPLKEYLISKDFIDYHDPKFEDDDIFYYIFLSLLKIDKKVSNFLNALNDWDLNGLITKININKYINNLYRILHYFEKIDKFLFFNKGPNFLINKNNNIYFYEKIGDKVLKYAITSISSEAEIEYDYYFIWLYIIPLLLWLLLFNKHVYYLKNKYWGLTNFIMMEWKFNILISNNFFYTLKVYLEWLTKYYTNIEFRSFNKNFYNELDQQHRLKTLSKVDRELVLNSIYDYMYVYKYNSYFMSKYRAYPGSEIVVTLNNITLMFLIYVLVYLYMNKNIYKYFKSKFYQYIQLITYYNNANSIFNNKEIEKLNTNEVKYSLIIYLYYTLNKSNIYLHYLSEIKNRIKKVKKWI